MRTLLFAVVVALAAASGCQPQSKSNLDADTPDPDDQGSSLRIEAPGVDVNIAPGKGVEVEAPGVDVEAKRDENGGEVKVDAGEPK